MSFNGISMGDGICQVLRSGSCFTLMYFDKNCLKIDPEIAREPTTGEADLGALRWGRFFFFYKVGRAD